MKFPILAFLGLSLLGFPSETQKPSGGYSQSYVILIKGIPAGSETVTETTNEAGDLVSSSDHEIFVTDGLDTKRMAFSTQMVLSKTSGIPTSYTYKYTTGSTGDSYEVTVKNSIITRTLNRGGRTNQVNIPVPANMVLVDFNVYHHYDYLVRKYDSAKGGRQLFSDFVPLIGDHIPLALTYLENGTLNSEKGPVPAKNYKVEFEGIWSGNLLTDAHGRLIKLSVPAQDLEVVRKDLVASNN